LSFTRSAPCTGSGCCGADEVNLASTKTVFPPCVERQCLSAIVRYQGRNSPKVINLSSSMSDCDMMSFTCSVRVWVNCKSRTRTCAPSPPRHCVTSIRVRGCSLRHACLLLTTAHETPYLRSLNGCPVLQHAERHANAAKCVYKADTMKSLVVSSIFGPFG
jgi:hypothetical protein